MLTKTVLFRATPILASILLISCNSNPAPRSGKYDSSAAGSPTKTEASASAASAEIAVPSRLPEDGRGGTESQVDSKQSDGADTRSAGAGKSGALGSTVPEGLYMLSWRTEQRDGVSVKMSVKSAEGSREAPGERFETEISTRNGEISGCVLSKEGATGRPAPAICRMSDGKLIIVINDEAGNGNAMELTMAPEKNGNYAGTISLTSALLPGGRIEIGKASLVRTS